MTWFCSEPPDLSKIVGSKKGLDCAVCNKDSVLNYAVKGQVRRPAHHEWNKENGIRMQRLYLRGMYMNAVKSPSELQTIILPKYLDDHDKTEN